MRFTVAPAKHLSRLLVLGGLVGGLLGAPAVAAQAAEPRPAHQCYALAHPDPSLVYREGERRLLCSLAIASADGSADLHADVSATRTAEGGVVTTLSIVAGDPASGGQTLWSRSGTGLGGAPVEDLADVVSFVPPGESHGHVALLLTRCGAYCGGSALIVLDVQADGVQEVLDVEGGEDPALAVAGPGVLVSWQDRPVHALPPRGTLNSLYAWSDGAYQLVDTVLETADVPNSGP